MISVREPGVLVAARRSSPLLVGVGDKEFVVASDGDVRSVLPSNDQLVRCGEFRTSTLGNRNFVKSMTSGQIELGTPY